jgi:hypothetical protein
MLAADPIRGGGMLGARGRAGDEVGAAAPVPTPGAVRALLAAWRSGDDGAVERLVPLVHDALDDLTARRLRAAVTADAPPLAPLALVDDAWRALADGAPAERGDRVRFAAVASRVVRRVLAVHARRAAALRPADRARRGTSGRWRRWRWRTRWPSWRCSTRGCRAWWSAASSAG